ncbi:hypothetical protein HPB47_005409 [Ixodes persulcatus]|uniref:Uncharacterized protein n=1 Tax=Ixodes persulcatus TaxID=34615 RepID=A0AC60PDB4_IXOPE|nr:hypothetical protein HPB47_005409 [Ixodes persulcatus]
MTTTAKNWLSGGLTWNRWFVKLRTRLLMKVVRSQTMAVVLSIGFYKNDLPENNKNRLKMLATFDGVWGHDFDMVLVRYFVQEFKKRYKLGVATNRSALMRPIT